MKIINSWPIQVFQILSSFMIGAAIGLIILPYLITHFGLWAAAAFVVVLALHSLIIGIVLSEAIDALEAAHFVLVSEQEADQ